MSTVKATNLQHPSAAAPAIVLNAAGETTVAGVGDLVTALAAKAAYPAADQRARRDGLAV